MKSISFFRVLVIFLALSAFFLAMAPTATVPLSNNYAKVSGVVRYNDFGSHFSLWNGSVYGGTVYLKLNGTVHGSCAIGSGGVYNITSDLADSLEYDFTLNTSALSDGNGTWIGSSSFHHYSGVENFEDIYAYPF